MTLTERRSMTFLSGHNWQRVKRWLYPGRSPRIVMSSNTDFDDDIPRSPPYEKGLPILPTARVMAREHELLGRIRQIFPFTDAEYEAIVLPVIEQYAAFVHLLPASEHHHHKSAGGLFRHGLEVAFQAGRGTGAYVFLPEGTPLERKRVEIRWKVAIFFAGLLHDIGKPLSDLEVVNRDGTIPWRPYTTTLEEWAKQHSVDRYFLRWRPQRAGSHRAMGATVYSSLIPRSVNEWLYEGGPEMHVAMADYLAAKPNMKHLLVELVEGADKWSVERNLEQSGHGKIRDPGFGVPVESFVLDAMRRLINSGAWAVNEPGARVWLISDGFSEGCYVVWKRGAEEIVELLREDRIAGIPRNPETLADILIERNLAEPRKLANEVFRYWPIAPDILCKNGQQVKLLMLRLSSPNLIFAEPPPFVSGQIALIGSAATPPEAAPAPAPSAPPAMQPAPAAAAPMQPAGPVCPACQTQHPHAVDKEAGWSCSSCGVVYPPAAQGAAATSAVKVTQPAAQAQSAGSSGITVVRPGQASPSSEQPASRKVISGAPATRSVEPAAESDFWPASSNEDASDEAPPQRTEETSLPSEKSNSSAPQPSDPETELAAIGPAGRLLIAMAKDIAAGHSMWGECLAQLGGSMLIPWPTGLERYLRFEVPDGEPDLTPANLGALLFNGGVIEVLDPTMPKKIREVAGTKGIVLQPKIALLVHALAGDGRRPEDAEPPRRSAPPARPVGRPQPGNRKPSDNRSSKKSATLPGPKAQASGRRDPELTRLAEDFLAWVRLNPPPEGVIDQGDFRIVPNAVINRYPGVQERQLLRLKMAVANHPAVRANGDEFIIAQEQTRG